MIQEQALQEVQAQIGYQFSDPNLLVFALTHASSTDSRVDSNERLEFLGDAILGMVVCYELYELFPEYLQGQLSKIKSAVVSRRTCAQISRQLGLQTCLFLGKGMSGRAQLPVSLAAAVYESLIAAIYQAGAGLGPTLAIITSWSGLALLTISFELPFLGWRFTLLRVGMGLAIPLLVGLAGTFLFGG